MRGLCSVPEAHKYADDDGGIVLEIIFSAKKINRANWTIRTNVMFFNKFLYMASLEL